jgi:hypothetical protein
MNPKDDKSPKEEAPKSAPPRRFDATLPMGRKPAPEEGEKELDLDLGDIQSRLPYGSEDIADK